MGGVPPPAMGLGALPAGLYFFVASVYRYVPNKAMEVPAIASHRDHFLPCSCNQLAEELRTLQLAWYWARMITGSQHGGTPTDLGFERQGCAKEDNRCANDHHPLHLHGHGS